MAIPLTVEINPKGNTTEERLEALVRQLRTENKELSVIIEDLYKEIEYINEKLQKEKSEKNT